MTAPDNAPDFRSPWWGERRSRYHFAARYVRAAQVMDLSRGLADTTILRDAGAASTTAAVNRSPIGARPARVDVVTADPTRLCFRDGSFDLALCLELSFDAEAAREIVSEMGRVLRPGGRAIVSVANRDHDPWIGERRAETGVYNRNTLEDMVSKDFSAIEVVGQFPDRRYPFAPFWQQADDVRREPVRAASWMFRHRMPHTIKDGLERLIRNRAFYPGEYDFVFTREHCEMAHRLIAIARR